MTAELAVPPLTWDERRLLAGVLRWARANGWARDRAVPGAWRQDLDGAAVYWDPDSGALGVSYLGLGHDLMPASPGQAVKVLWALGLLPDELLQLLFPQVTDVVTLGPREYVELVGLLGPALRDGP